MEDSQQGPATPDRAAEPSTSQAIGPVYFGTALAIAFAVGLFVGLTGRPLVIGDVPVQVIVTVVPEQSSDAVAQAPATPASQAIAQNAGEEAAGDGTATPTIMEFVMADARHVQGDPDAPVTMVEYSDFK